MLQAMRDSLSVRGMVGSSVAVGVGVLEGNGVAVGSGVTVGGSGVLVDSEVAVGSEAGVIVGAADGNGVLVGVAERIASVVAFVESTRLPTVALAPASRPDFWSVGMMDGTRVTVGARVTVSVRVGVNVGHRPAARPAVWIPPTTRLMITIAHSAIMPQKATLKQPPAHPCFFAGVSISVSPLGRTG